MRLLALAAATGLVVAYDFVKEYSGPNFFSDWDFFGSWDNLTLGDTNWVNATDAWGHNLISVNQAGNVVITVDQGNVDWNFKRDAVRITTQDTYNLGTLWIFDVYHIPWGCGVWPSIWTMGPDWPQGGEIDIIEGINRQPANQIAVHTSSGCTHDPNAWQSGASGAADCSLPSGCLVKQTDDSQPSFGDSFAQAGGGVWAVQYDIEGIFIWFWTRARVPQELYQPAAESLDINAWGQPVAAFPSTTCSMTSFWAPQKIVIDTTFCGNWAGVPDLYAETCAGMPSTTGAPATGVCYVDNVIGPGSPRFDDAYWEIANIRAYTTGTNGPVATSLPDNSPSTNVKVPASAAVARTCASSSVPLLAVIVGFLWMLP
ncbi:hypothetical protein EXIGLDRAFT_724659 [Exidia glandulosa HHB12029]|uniref:GH16 domain-containing protein n=1 Tax=Exidia glandulosa HHB12029 TaxID=1314781 RepID=A0A165MRJ4_EXIGL|nr:hypothetical protein EXIGLDRAFT_724659 [Exidia glandulosa HHB12029]